MNLSDVPAQILFNRNFAHEAHLAAAGTSFQGDHTLLLGIYTGLTEDYDETSELMLGAGVELSRTEVQTGAAERMKSSGGVLQSGDINAILRTVRQNEATLVRLLTAVLDGKLPHPGLVTHFQDLQKSSLHRSYFLTRRLKL